MRGIKWDIEFWVLLILDVWAANRGAALLSIKEESQRNFSSLNALQIMVAYFSANFPCFVRTCPGPSGTKPLALSSHFLTFYLL